MKMELKLKFIYKMKKLILLLSASLLLSCTNNNKELNRKDFYFDTVISSTIYNSSDEHLTRINDIYSIYDKLSDNYLKRDINNVYTINNSSDEVIVDSKLYELLKLSYDINLGIDYFNILCGTLAKKYKEVNNENKKLDEEIVNEELNNIKTTSIEFKENNVVRKSGKAEIDLGGIVKGYVLDKVKDYFSSNNISSYIIDAGSSSILLGNKNTKDGLFTIGLKDYKDGYLKEKECFISTSGNSTQGLHIVNPITGKLADNYDAVIVISNLGYIGDVLSTTFMLCSVDEIKSLESKYQVKSIVIKDNNIIYKNDNIKLYK